MSMINLPTPQQGDVHGVVRNGEVHIVNPQGYTVKRVTVRIFDTQIEQYVANEIAAAINEARNIGFEQGRAHVRAAIGAHGSL